MSASAFPLNSLGSQRLTLRRLPPFSATRLPPLAMGLLELTGGVTALKNDAAGFCMAAALLGWGGLSVHCQTAAVTAGSGIPMGRYLPAKAVQAALSAGLAWLAAPRWGLPGVWAAMCAELCTRGALFLLRMARGKWLDKGALA